MAAQDGVDVVVVGAGNAALCAALAARESGASVLALERAPEQERGGNTAFTGGLMRVAYNDVSDLQELMDLSSSELAHADFGSYPEDAFYADLAHITEYRADPVLADMVVSKSRDALRWMRHKGVRFVPSYGRQAFEVGGRYKFWGGVPVEVSGGGAGLIASLVKAAERDGVALRYGTRAVGLEYDETGVCGVRYVAGTESGTICARSVVLACGGFEADAEWRARYLGPGWDLAKVRGTRYNTGDGIKMALDVGATPHGHWSGCHAVCWDRNATDFGDWKVRDSYQKHSYPFGIMVNVDGKRFVDEGADFRNYTYAKYGRAVLEQPSQVAWQVFDAQITRYLRDEYRIRQVTKVSASTLPALASKMELHDAAAFLATVEEFNNAIMRDTPFDPNVKDGRGTKGVSPPKSNWANAIEKPPFEAYAVTCGVTFTFGGLKISEKAEVTRVDGEPIPGLYACGELVGGLFYFNYPGGSGLTAGSVLGRVAGERAALFADSAGNRLSGSAPRQEHRS